MVRWVDIHQTTYEFLKILDKGFYLQQWIRTAEVHFVHPLTLKQSYDYRKKFREYLPSYLERCWDNYSWRRQ
jgi:hypothetical protein